MPQNGFVATKFVHFVDFVQQNEQNQLTNFVNFVQNHLFNKICCNKQGLLTKYVATRFVN